METQPQSKALTIEEKHAIILDIMKDIDSFCRKNNIRYAISDGTMLGAVRHKGFIPWDDDADLAMPREDFEKFLKTYKSDKYHLLFNTRTEDEYFVFPYIKISDPSTKIHFPKTDDRYGVFIDIFPFDYVPEDEKERFEYANTVRRLDNRIWHKHKKDLFSKIKSCRHSLDWYWDRIDQMVHSGKYDDSPLVAQLVCMAGIYKPLKRDVFDTLTDYEFEGCKFLGFKDYDQYLSSLFGADYMTPRKWAHNYVAYRKEDFPA